MLVEDAPSSSSRPNLATSDSFQIASSSGPNHQRAPNGPWYDDGNIVVLAENTVFKVYKGILAESCDAFREMFSFPQPDELPAEELWEGCPLVPLTDSPQEVSVFLKAIFKESTFLRVPAKQTYPNVLSILRLSNKYGNAELQFKALEHLSTTLPTTLSEFDAVDATKTLASPRRVDRFRAADIIAESGETWLLPMALFRVIQMCTVEKIYMGVTEGEETVKMSSRNQLACLQAYVKNIKAVREILTFLSPVPLLGARLQRPGKV
ncbi:hypothetical protein DL96DRAFT_1458188 [Flagelloscypha sp. PMI_526]|nr:hypothetical protein DL96DRAFT_1458188 [Flagelloscypha sp. PMI_526]